MSGVPDDSLFELAFRLYDRPPPNQPAQKTKEPASSSPLSLALPTTSRPNDAPQPPAHSATLPLCSQEQAAAAKRKLLEHFWPQAPNAPPAEKPTPPDQPLASDKAPPTSRLPRLARTSPVGSVPPSEKPRLAGKNAHCREPSKGEPTQLPSLEQTRLLFESDAPSRPESHSFNPDAIKTWYYPSHYEKRDYQYSIVKTALLHNTLVCLPTGLGKTLIAAVVIYNFYHWFPRSKILFMAPAKPLVNQQIDACRDIVNIPSESVVCMTGQNPPETRSSIWARNRVFFVTPHVPANDIASGICPSRDISLVVVDEAHKAQGNYSYCEVIRRISETNKHFRVLALTATPGSSPAAIQSVIKSLMISKIEHRTELSPDVRPYVHSTDIEQVRVQLNQPILRAKALLTSLINKPISWLQTNGALYRLKQGESFTFNRIEAARKTFRAKSPGIKDYHFKSNVEAHFAAAMTFHHGLRLVNNYGLKPFKEWVNTQSDRPLREKTSVYFNELIKSVEWSRLYVYVNEIPESSMSHPKMAPLETLVLRHFNAKNEATRVIIFAQFRETVDEIVSLLSKHHPTIRPIPFVGQSKKGLSQKKQSETMSKFRSGDYNTMVSTSIGEEGLDIGEVDLIVCFDSQTSLIRMIQRIGRTGRKRKGKCIMLLTEGEEDASYQKLCAKKKTFDASKFQLYNPLCPVLPFETLPPLGSFSSKKTSQPVKQLVVQDPMAIDRPSSPPLDILPIQTKPTNTSSTDLSVEFLHSEKAPPASLDLSDNSPKFELEATTSSPFQPSPPPKHCNTPLLDSTPPSTLADTPPLLTYPDHFFSKIPSHPDSSPDPPNPPRRTHPHVAAGIDLLFPTLPSCHQTESDSAIHLTNDSLSLREQDHQWKRLKKKGSISSSFSAESNLIRELIDNEAAYSSEDDRASSSQEPPNTQDRDFIVNEGDLEDSTTVNMRAIYSRSLSSQVSVRPENFSTPEKLKRHYAKISRMMNFFDRTGFKLGKPKP
ncbi:uncharacterized protein LOC126316936 [Schistocerca gregaria]|uniref:uncharacterized protein LOC126316936 n=1 Tax=Schistocerca gregaria TaxID=7010 RepID=UPI00211F3D35|nr:uncharacterized protein LOC126316936 [Schistocerca gregaria]